MTQTRDGEPDEQRPGQERLVRGPRLALHEPLGRLAVAQADRLEDLDREVHEQRLERDERDAAEHVEDAGAQEQ